MNICPFCQTVISGPTHIYVCHKKPLNLTKAEIKIKYLLSKFSHINKSDFLKDYQDNLFSLTDLRKKYNIDFKAALYLLTYWGVKTRNISESAKKITIVKSKKTCLERYGYDHVLSKNGIARKNSQKTLKEKYNVENSFQIPEVKAKITSDELWLEKFGVTRRVKRSIDSKESWAVKTIEEKFEWLSKSILTTKKLTNKNGKSSKLEEKIQSVLNNMGITYTRQFKIIQKSHLTFKWYDFMLSDFNVILEVNGDYWHANPALYKPIDVIEYPFGQRMALEIWEKDRKKLEIARNKGFTVAIIWEKEMRNKNDKELEKIIIDILLKQCIVVDNNKGETCNPK